MIFASRKKRRHLSELPLIERQPLRAADERACSGRRKAQHGRQRLRNCTLDQPTSPQLCTWLKLCSVFRLRLIIEKEMGVVGGRIQEKRPASTEDLLCHHIASSQQRSSGLRQTKDRNRAFSHRRDAQSNARPPTVMIAGLELSAELPTPRQIRASLLGSRTVNREASGQVPGDHRSLNSPDLPGTTRQVIQYLQVGVWPLNSKGVSLCPGIRASNVVG